MLTRLQGRSLVQEFASNGVIVLTFEHMIVPYPDGAQPVQTLLWLEQVEAMLDGYNWLIGSGLLSSRTLFQNQLSQLWNAVRHFVLFMATPHHTRDMSPSEQENLNRRTGTVGVRIFDLLTLAPRDVPESTWSPDLFKYIMSATLTPHKLSFDWTDPLVLTNLPHVTTLLLRALISLPPTTLDMAARSAATIMSSDGSLLNITRNLTSSTPHGTIAAALASGYYQLHSIGLLDRVLRFCGLEDTAFFGEIFSFLSHAPRYEPVTQAAAKRTLEVALLKTPADAVLGAIFNDEPVAVRTAMGAGSDFLLEGDDASNPLEPVATQGSIFHMNFAQTLHQHLAAHFSDFSDALVSRFRHPRLCIVIQGMLSTLKADKSIMQKHAVFGRTFVKFLAGLVHRWLPATATREARMDALSLLSAFAQLDCTRRDMVGEDADAVCDFVAQLLTDASIGLDSEGNRRMKLMDWGS